MATSHPIADFLRTRERAVRYAPVSPSRRPRWPGRQERYRRAAVRGRAAPAGSSVVQVDPRCRDRCARADAQPEWMLGQWRHGEAAEVVDGEGADVARFGDQHDLVFDGGDHLPDQLSAVHLELQCQVGGAIGQSAQARLRALTYGTADLTLELEVHSGELIGQVIPAVEDEVVLVTETGDVRTFTVDDFGCFTVSPLPEHPFRLRIGAGAPVTTPWINLHD